MVTLESVNQQMFGGITMSSILSALGWIIAVIIFLVAIGFGIWWYYNKRLFNKKITVFDLINGYYQPTIRDRARTVKLGSGGFEILYLQKLKVYKMAYGTRVGKDMYYFFILPDGYWYNGLLSGTVTKDGTIPIISTNPLARAQYTALEKYVETLYSEKKGFWDKYGNWVLSGMFILIIGVFSWLSFKELSSALSQFPDLINKLSQLVDKINQLLAAADRSGSGLYKAG